MSNAEEYLERAEALILQAIRLIEEDAWEGASPLQQPYLAEAAALLERAGRKVSQARDAGEVR